MIDFDGIDGQPLEVIERRVAGAEVVDGDLDPRLLAFTVNRDPPLYLSRNMPPRMDEMR
ncbi:MAG: hypothetical protein M0037_05330 [Betaproteobacteria bacterium]|nr:hypothetical protein [Betaproteobacteria bacterium]